MFQKAQAEDCRAVYKLICDMEQKELPYDRFHNIFLGQLARPDFYCLLLKEEGQVLGMLNLRFEEQLHHAARIAEIMELAVAPSCRNNGLGKALFLHACTLAKEAGCIQMEVACNQLRKDTHRFYLREGMRNFHYKFSKSLTGEDMTENRLGR
ncbi:GNAT family N-acetyltransferase [Anaerotignum lactatifermentans]|uniref:GNAT family N-acetyltransferase n=1 Tax=Anaerotignum lactatifermentans TaxID=160404 RepID=A0ABS2G5M5_9FIRM|nr:GNAT family N-acetyltransferase [Anaerotignum lactatifermentans]MBM6828091.1 GNAT family N-acetyltransferase [Anaerotignum lactatifermentans]MBM6876746.1 GNAT family N-acetyltransferase [Anaerotignum lactatifermentans]MBM6949674.1 GNAT family N-acetyltransferase [Anaerotignum lactatifermentans]